VLQVFVEDLVPGNEAAHAKAERGWANLACDTRHPDPILERTPLFGPRQCWIVNGFASFAALERAAARIAGDAVLRDRVAALDRLDRGVVAAERVMALRLRPELGRTVAVPWAKARYYWVHEVQVRPGHGPDYERELTGLAAAHEKAGLSQPWFVHQAVAGRPDPTYLVIIPLATLGELDALLASQGKVAAAPGEERATPGDEGGGGGVRNRGLGAAAGPAGDELRAVLVGEGGPGGVARSGAPGGLAHPEIARGGPVVRRVTAPAGRCAGPRPAA
jgi:hypothetical protein